jgi:Xaa-Pro aminopeptidase
VTSPNEIERRYASVREAAVRDGLDAVVVSGSEYTGFEGAVRYLSGFRILHRYAYVVLPVDGEPAIVFPKEARWVGDHGETWIEDSVFAEQPGEWVRERAHEDAWKRIGVYGLDYVMAVRDYRALTDGLVDVVPWDQGFDLARAVKSEEEIESVRESFRINEEGWLAVLAAYEVGRTEAELMAVAEDYFTARGTYRTTMDMVLTGHWVEVSRAIGSPGPVASHMLEAYEEYFDAARDAFRPGATAHDVHRAVSNGFLERGFLLGHVTGHSIGMTMIEHPRIGEGNETELRENMVVSMHPHAITEDERTCLYMQDTWLVTAEGGVPFSSLPIQIFTGTEEPAGLSGA